MKRSFIFMAISIFLIAPHICAIDSKMTITNNSNEKILVIPIPENSPPYLLATVPTSKRPAGFSGTYIATPAEISIPDRIKYLFFITESLFEPFQAFVEQQKKENDQYRPMMGPGWRPDWKKALEQTFLTQYTKQYWTIFDWNKTISPYISYKTVMVPLIITSATWINQNTPPLKITVGFVKYFR